MIWSHPHDWAVLFVQSKVVGHLRPARAAPDSIQVRDACQKWSGNIAKTGQVAGFEGLEEEKADAEEDKDRGDMDRVDVSKFVVLITFVHIDPPSLGAVDTRSLGCG